MLVREVAGMFRRLTGEPDQTFLDDVDLTLILQQAYEDFRSIVLSMDPWVYLTSVDVTLSDVDTLDLAVTAPTILGASPSVARMHSLHSIWTLNGTQLRRRLIPGWTFEDIQDGAADYMLAGTSLNYDRARSEDQRIFYVPAMSASLWSNPSTSSSHIDELTAYHGLIACIAYLHYAVEDGADSPQQLRLMKRLESQLRRHLETRSGHDVVPVDNLVDY